MSTQLNDDFSRFAVMRTADMEWLASPSPKVWRKRLELRGAVECGRVTSLVRFDADSNFAAHDHPQGEEILVLEGTFSDEHGDYPAGTYLLNPEGFRHAPFSRTGCSLFVKLRQFHGTEHVVVDTTAEGWLENAEGRQRLPLFAEEGFNERTFLSRLAPGTRIDRHSHPGGEEVFVLQGTLQDENGHYGPGCWLRYPDGSRHSPYSDAGCLLYVKIGHLA